MARSEQQRDTLARRIGARFDRVARAFAAVSSEKFAAAAVPYATTFATLIATLLEAEQLRLDGREQDERLLATAARMAAIDLCTLLGIEEQVK